jgi:hypothetical protein
MSDTTGRRRTKLADPTAERPADPIPDGKDILDRDESGRLDTPRRYDLPEEEAEQPSKDAKVLRRDT